MKNLKINLIVIFVITVLTSCSVTYPMFLTNNPIGTKTGVSTMVTLFSGGYANSATPAPVMGKTIYNGIMLNSQFGLKEATKSGKIATIATVDIRYDWYFFFSKKTLIVTGE